MYMTPVISTSTRITTDSCIGVMHLNALNDSSDHYHDKEDSPTLLYLPTYEDAISFTRVNNLQSANIFSHSRSRNVTERSSPAPVSINKHRTELPPTYDDSVHKIYGNQRPNNCSVQNTVVVNGEVVTEDIAYTRTSGRLSIVSRTSISGYPVHRDVQNSIKKWRIRHYTCIIFAIVVALGIPTFIVLMTSGVINGMNPQINNKDSTNNAQHTSGLQQQLPKEDAGFRRKRQTDGSFPALLPMLSEGDELAKNGLTVKQRNKRYQDMIYRVNLARMHTGLHNHKIFMRQFLIALMKNYY